jgi:hypothetical protein
MPAVLLKTDLAVLMGSLQVGERYASLKRREQIRECCTDWAELPLLVADYYRKVYPDRVETRFEAKLRDREFFDKHCHVRVAKDDNQVVGGFCVLGDQLLALHSSSSGRGTWLLDHAIALGATRLDCFDIPQLRALYEGRGFTVIRTEPNWDAGGLPVIHMELS